MTLEEKIVSYFAANGWDKKPDHIKWTTIGHALGISGDSAWEAWRRCKKTRKESKLTQNVIVSDKPNHFVTPGTYLVLGCVHAPFHNRKVIEGIYKLIIDIKDQIAGIVLLGDFLDLNTLSSHDKGKFTALPNLTLDKEYAEGNVILDALDNLLPLGCHKGYLFGNHENRHARWMADVQNAKTPLESPDSALKLQKRGYIIKTQWEQDMFKLGSHLELIHGTYWNKYAASKHIDVFRGSILFAHTHRIQTYVEGSVGGFNIGTLADISSPAFNYASRGMKAQWQNGFATVVISPEGEYFVNQIIICNDKFAYNGKIY